MSSWRSRDHKCNPCKEACEGWSEGSTRVSSASTCRAILFLLHSSLYMLEILQFFTFEIIFVNFKQYKDQQFKYFAMCVMHATYYSNERFSAFQMYILPLQYELNLNSFLYLNKIYNNDCCEVKAFEFVSLF